MIFSILLLSAMILSRYQVRFDDAELLQTKPSAYYTDADLPAPRVSLYKLKIRKVTVMDKAISIGYFFQYLGQ